MPEAKLTGAKRKIDGVEFFSWDIGMLRYEQRTADGRGIVRDNVNRSTYCAYLDDELLGNRFHNGVTAARAVVREMRRIRRDELGVHRLMASTR